MSVKAICFGGNGTGTPLGDAALALLRLGIGLMIAFGHGMSKLFQEGHFGPTEQFVQSVGKMGFPAPTLFAWCSALAEFVGGLLIALGFLTRPAAAVLAFNMAVAAFITHLHAPFVSMQGPSKESALLYLLPCLLLLVIGAGRYSFDALWRRSFEREAE
jgi:putative oxidoreductase